MKHAPKFLLLCLTIMLLVAACQEEQPATSIAATTAPATPEASADPAEEPATEQSAEAPDRGQEDSRLTSPPGAANEDEEPEEEPAAQAAGMIFAAPFDVRPDGFSFRNYSTSFPEGRFTIRELRAQFGDDVCSRIDEDGVCIPTAEAQQWIDDRNADMSYGHCIGFTVVSYRFAEGDIEPAAFTPGAGAPFDIERDVPIMRQISANGALYWARDVWSSEVSGTPREVLDALIALEEPVDLSIYLPGLAGGHSLLAYAVQEVEPGQYRIHVYDNNFPGEELYVEVDYEANTWRYDQGAVNPDMTSFPYEGDATTETLRFIPLTAYENVPCPFCVLSTPAPADDEDQAEDEGFTLLTLLGDGDFLVTTLFGDIGLIAGELVNEIPGATFIFGRGQLAANDAPDVVLPAGLDYSIAYTGLERISSLSQGYSVTLDDLIPTTEESSLSVTLADQTLEYVAGDEQKPVIRSTVRNETATYSVALLDVDFSNGQGVSMGVTKSGTGLEISSENAAISDSTLLIARLTEEDEAIFATSALDIADGGSVALDVSTWDGSGSMDVYVDENGDGEFTDEPNNLSNEPLTDILQQGDNDQAGQVINKLSPFLGSQGIEALLAGLADEHLSGREMGEILQQFDLTDEQLVRLLNMLELSPPDLAELLHALALGASRLDTIISGLDLPSETEADLRAFLEDLALYRSIIIDWEFLDSDDMGELAALINDRELVVDQVIQLVPRLRLTEPDQVVLVTELALTSAERERVITELGLDISATPTVRPTATRTRQPTPTRSATITPTATAGSATRTPTATPRATALPGTATVPAPAPTEAPDGYPGAPPPPTATPAPYPYPYPGPLPSPTPTPAAAYPYPGPQASPTPAYQSRAFCSGDNLRVIAEEPTWIEAAIEIWAGETLLIEGVTGGEDEAFEATFTGPGTWEDLFILSSITPKRVPFRTPITCP